MADRTPIFFDNRSVEIRVPGKPFAKQRPRVTARGPFARAYTPKQTVEYEAKVRDSFTNLYSKERKLEGPLEAEIVGVFPVPKSAPKQKKSDMISGKIYHTSKPDCDNMGKIVLDALNDVVYHDDSQICKLNISKRYGEFPRIDVKLKEIK